MKIDKNHSQLECVSRLSRVAVKAGLWTLDWTVETGPWTGIWTETWTELNNENGHRLVSP